MKGATKMQRTWRSLPLPASILDYINRLYMVYRRWVHEPEPAAIQVASRSRRVAAAKLRAVNKQYR